MIKQVSDSERKSLRITDEELDLIMAELDIDSQVMIVKVLIERECLSKD